jgi:hypothetical protein
MRPRRRTRDRTINRPMHKLHGEVKKENQPRPKGVVIYARRACPHGDKTRKMIKIQRGENARSSAQKPKYLACL